MGDRLPHLQLGHRLAFAVVGREDRLALRRADDHLETLVGLETAHQLGRLEAGEGVDVAGQQRVDLRRGILDELEHDLVQLDRRRVAVGLGLGQGDRFAFLAFDELERAGADRVGAVGWRALGIDQGGVGDAEIEQDEGVGILHRDLDRGGIDHLDAVDRAIEILGRHLGVGRDQPVDREFHVRRVEGFAVVVLHAGAQLEDVLLAVGRHGPALGQAGHDVAVAVDARQALVDVLVGDLANRGGGVEARIEHRRLQRQADDDVVAGRLGRRRRRRRRGRRGCGGRSRGLRRLRRFHGLLGTGDVVDGDDDGNRRHQQNS